MAAAGAPLPPWDPDNPEEQDLIYRSDRSDLVKALNEAGPTLAANLKLDDIWPYLKQLQILETNDEERIKYGRARPDQASALLSFIKKGQRWQYHAVMRAMVLTGQGHLVPKGGPGPEVYRDQGPQADPSSPEIELDTQKPLDQDLLKIIKDHCKYNKGCLKRVHIFAFEGDPGDDYIDITPCYINVDPKIKDQNRAMVPIAASKILEKIGDSDPPLVIRIYGQPGDGKTSFTMNVAYTWSVAFMEQLTMKDGKLSLKSKCPLWTTMVFIKARNIKTTVEEAIFEELGCKRKDKEVLMAHVRNGEGVAILIEAMDELHDPQAIQELKNYVKECRKSGGPTILITSRTDLCSIDGQDFDRFLTLEGFTEDQALCYVKLYTESCKVPQPTECPLPSQVLDYVTTHKEKMKAVLSNPLKLHIYCALVMRGEIKLSETDKLSISKLLGVLELYLLKRGGIKVTQEQSNDFYRFCMHAILNDLREFPSNLLHEFNVVESYHVFMDKYDRRGSDGGLDAYYSFGHEVVLEYFASRYIYSLNSEDQLSFLLLSCCDESWGNIQYIIFQMLAEDGEDRTMLMQTMIRSILILQFKGSCEGGDSILSDLMHLKEQIVPPTKDILCSKISKTSPENVVAIHEKINIVFDNHAQLLRDSNWLGGVHGNHLAFNDVVECIKMCSPDARDVLIKDTILCLMPGECKWIYEEWYYAVSGTRWATVQFPDLWGKVKCCEVEAWSPADAADAILQISAKVLDEPLWGVRKLNLGSYELHDLWGLPSKDDWSKVNWDKCLQGMLQGVRMGLDINLPRTAPLTGLLSSIVANAQDLSECGTVRLNGGVVEFNEMLESVLFCKEAGIDLQFHGSCVFVSEDIAALEMFTSGQLEDIHQESAVQWAHGSWANGSLSITLKETAPLTYVLSLLLGNAQYLSQCQDLSKCATLKLNGGVVEFNEMLESVLFCKEAGIDLQFHGSCVFVSEDIGALEIFTSGQLEDNHQESAAQWAHGSWANGSLTIILKETAPLTEVLYLLLDNAEQLSKCKQISVEKGTVKLEEIMSWLARCKDSGLKLTLPGSHVEVDSLRQNTHNITKAACDKCLAKFKVRNEIRLCQLNHQVKDQLSISLNMTGPLAGLLSYLLDHGIQFSNYKLSVRGGAAVFEDLIPCLSRSKQLGLPLPLYNTVVIVSSALGKPEEIQHQPPETRPEETLQMEEIDNGDSHLIFVINECSSPVSLLSHLPECKEQLSQWNTIEVVNQICLDQNKKVIPSFHTHEKTHLDDLLKVATKCHQAGLNLVLKNLTLSGNLFGSRESVAGKVVLSEAFRQHLSIKVQDEESPLAPGMLQYIHDCIEYMPLVREIALSSGTISLPDLVMWMSKYEEAGLYVNFKNTQVVVPDRLLILEDDSNRVGNSSQRTQTLAKIVQVGWWSQMGMTIDLAETTPLTGLLSWIIEHAKQLSSFTNITMKGGTGKLDDLMNLLYRCKEKRLHVKFVDVHIVLHNGKTDQEGRTSWLRNTDVQKGLLELDPDTQMRVDLDNTSSITSLQPCLLKHATRLSRYQNIHLRFGNTKLRDLLTIVSSCKDAGLTVVLEEVGVLLYENTDHLGTKQSGLSTTQKTRVILQMKLTWQVVGKMILVVESSTPLMHLMSCLLDNTEHLSQCKNITVHSGTANLSNIFDWMSTDHQDGLQFEFYETNVVLAEIDTDVKDQVGGNLLKELADKRVRICLTNSASLTQLLPCLLNHTLYLEQCKPIHVENATATLGELVTCMSRCKEKGIQLTLSNTSVTGPSQISTTDEGQLHQLHDGSMKDTLTLETVFCSRDVFFMYFDETNTCPVTDLLSQLPGCSQQLLEWDLIRIANGTAELGELGNCVTKCQQAGLKLMLCGVVLPASLNIKLYGKLSTQSERSLLLIKEWYRERLNIQIVGPFPLTSLLLELAITVSSAKEIAVSEGTIKLDDVVPWVSRFKEAGLQLTLPYTNVLVPEEMKSNNCETRERALNRCPVIIGEWEGERLQIQVDETILLAALLSRIQQEVADLPAVKKLLVSNRSLGLTEVMPWISRFEAVGVELTWCNTQVILPEEMKAEENKSAPVMSISRLMPTNVVGRYLIVEENAPTLNPIVQKWSRQVVSISLPETCPLTRVLEWLMEHVHHLSQCRRITIKFGNIDLEDLIHWLSSYSLYGLNLTVLHIWTEVPDRGQDKALSLSKLELIGDNLVIDLYETTPLTYLLSHLATLAPCLMWYDVINIRYGSAPLGDLCSCISNCRREGLNLVLHDTLVLLPNRPIKDNYNALQANLIDHAEIVWMLEDALTMSLDWTVNVTEVLSVLLAHAPQMSHCNSIHLLHGTAELDDLIKYACQCKKAGLKLELSYTHITGPNSMKYWENLYYYNQFFVSINGEQRKTTKQAMDMNWAGDNLKITLPNGAPLTELLSTLYEQLVHLSKCREVLIEYGTAELGDLMTWVAKFEQEGLRLWLFEPYIIVSDKPVDRAHSFDDQFFEDPGIRVMPDGWEIHTVLF